MNKYLEKIAEMSKEDKARFKKAQRDTINNPYTLGEKGKSFATAVAVPASFHLGQYAGQTLGANSVNKGIRRDAFARARAANAEATGGFRSTGLFKKSIREAASSIPEVPDAPRLKGSAFKDPSAWQSAKLRAAKAAREDVLRDARILQKGRGALSARIVRGLKMSLLGRAAGLAVSVPTAVGVGRSINKARDARIKQNLGIED